MAAGDTWSRFEVEATVDDYLHMLTLELAGQAYSKTEHRRALQQRLDDRTDGSIELKHQNISAIMIQLGCPYINGYKPRTNFQALLFDVVCERVANDSLFNLAAASAVEQPAAIPSHPSFGSILVDPPRAAMISEPAPPLYWASGVAIRRDYVERENRNRSLGRAGEELVLAYEQFRLHTAGKRSLSERVEHVAATKGDGLGYDVLSFDTDGRERIIEVKTTAFGKETPFYVSRNEVSFSAAMPEQFHLYRLFEFRREPRLFDLQGRVEDRCRLDPVSYLARVV